MADASSPCPSASAEVLIRAFRFSPDVIMMVVRWYPWYCLSYRKTIIKDTKTHQMDQDAKLLAVRLPMPPQSRPEARGIHDHSRQTPHRSLHD